jgi:hypothetical protein
VLNSLQTASSPQKSIWDCAKDAFCALPPLELSGGADAYLGIGASASLGIPVPDGAAVLPAPPACAGAGSV